MFVQAATLPSPHPTWEAFRLVPMARRRARINIRFPEGAGEACNSRVSQFIVHKTLGVRMAGKWPIYFCLIYNRSDQPPNNV